MKRFLMLGIVSLVVSFLLGAQGVGRGVDTDEFTDIVAKTINFINYDGAYAKTDTLDQILAIGRGLSQGITKGKDTTGTYGDRYYVLHIIGTPEQAGKPADILVLTPQAAVDHIDNIRRIISSYLQATYAYAKPDADILAVFITVYNAVHRGNLTFFEGRYKAPVMAKLTAEKVGLSIRYNDWPGKTQVVIPLNLGAVVSGIPGTLLVVSAKDLVTPEVIATIRDKPGSGTTERQQLANLLDRTVDQTQNQIDQQKADLAKQQQAIDQKLSQVNQQLGLASAAADATKPQDPASKLANGGTGATVVAAGPGPAPATTPSPSASPGPSASPASSGSNPSASTAASTVTAPVQTQELQTQKQQLEAQKAQAQDQQKQLDQQQAANNDLAKTSQDLRDGTATDLKNQGQQNAVANTPVIAIKSRLEKDLILGQAIKVIPATSEILGQSASSNLIGRRIYPFGDGLIAIDYDGAKGTLILLAEKDLAIVKKGKVVISPYSELVILPNGIECLAVMQQDGEWYLGRFDAQLNPLARSAIPVDPIGALVVKDTMVLVQRKDGRISSLNLADLRSGQ